jgi:hypothetical protein
MPLSSLRARCLHGAFTFTLHSPYRCIVHQPGQLAAVSLCCSHLGHCWTSHTFFIWFSHCFVFCNLCDAHLLAKVGMQSIHPDTSANIGFLFWGPHPLARRLCGYVWIHHLPAASTMWGHIQPSSLCCKCYNCALWPAHYPSSLPTVVDMCGGDECMCEKSDLELDIACLQQALHACRGGHWLTFLLPAVKCLFTGNLLDSDM